MESVVRELDRIIAIRGPSHVISATPRDFSNGTELISNAILPGMKWRRMALHRSWQPDAECGGAVCAADSCDLSGPSFRRAIYAAFKWSLPIINHPPPKARANPIWSGDKGFRHRSKSSRICFSLVEV
jgi:hypothetical protein